MLLDQEIKTTLLSILNAVSQGISEELLVQKVRLRISPDLTEPQLRTLLRELADAGHAVGYKPELAAKRWKITALGTAALAEVGLA